MGLSRGRVSDGEVILLGPHDDFVGLRGTGIGTKNVSISG